MSEERVSRDDLNRLRRTAGVSVDLYLLDHPEVERLSRAGQSRVAVDVALGFLLSQGMIRIAPDEEWPISYPGAWRHAISEHLWPDLAEGGF